MTLYHVSFKVPDMAFTNILNLKYYLFRELLCFKPSTDTPFSYILKWRSSTWSYIYSFLFLLDNYWIGNSNLIFILEFKESWSNLLSPIQHQFWKFCILSNNTITEVTFGRMSFIPIQKKIVTILISQLFQNTYKL